MIPVIGLSFASRNRAQKSVAPLSIEHAAAVETLDPRHSDPFDRVLIVQARHEGLRFLTADDKVLAYGTPAVDARA